MMHKRFCHDPAAPSELLIYRRVTETRLRLEADDGATPSTSAAAVCAPHGLADFWVAYVADLAMAAHVGCKRWRRSNGR